MRGSSGAFDDHSSALSDFIARGFELELAERFGILADGHENVMRQHRLRNDRRARLPSVLSSWAPVLSCADLLQRE